MSRRQSVPFNVFYRKADPLPPLFPEPHDGDMYLNTTRGVLRHFLHGQWRDIEGMRWVPFTASGQQFHTDDVTRDGAWTMVANKDTKDRPAPQATGPATDLLPAWTPTISSAKADYTVENTWTLSTAGWIDRVGFNVHASNVGMTHTLSCLVNGSVVQTVAFVPPASQGGTLFWYQTFEERPLAPGTKVTLRLTVTSTAGGNADRYWYSQTGLFSSPPPYCSAATGKKDSGATGTTAYGVHLEFTPGVRSPDWDVVAVSGLGGGISDIEALDARYDARYVNMTGEQMSGGLGFGSAVGADVADVTRHLALYGTTYGLGVTASTLNYNANSGANHIFRQAGTERARVTTTGIQIPSRHSLSHGVYGSLKEGYVGLITWKNNTAQEVAYLYYDAGYAIVSDIEITISGDYNYAPAMGAQTRSTTFYTPWSTSSATQIYTDDIIDNYGTVGQYFFIGPCQNWQDGAGAKQLPLWPIYKAGSKTDLYVTVKTHNGSPLTGLKLYGGEPPYTDVYNHNIPMQHTSWVGLSLLNGWVNYDGRTARVRRTVAGQVHLDGVIRSGSGQVCTLPAGFRPLRGNIDIPVSVAGGVAIMVIGAAGDISIQGPTAGGDPASWAHMGGTFAL